MIMHQYNLFSNIVIVLNQINVNWLQNVKTRSWILRNGLIVWYMELYKIKFKNCGVVRSIYNRLHDFMPGYTLLRNN